MRTYFASDLARCMAHARYDNNMTWGHINELWYDRYASDRRYKVWFGAGSRNHYFMRIGDTRYIVRFIDGKTYCRPYNDSDKYNDMACFECIPIEYDNYIGWRVEWQNDVLI